MLNNTLNQYKDYIKTSLNFSSNSIIAYSKDLDDYFEFLEKNYSLSNANEITNQHIRNYISRLKRKDHTSTSIGRKMSAIRSYHTFLSQKKLVNDNVSLDVALPKRYTKDPLILSVEEIEALLTVCDGDDPLQLRNRAMIEILYGCGLRIGELLALQLSDLHLNMGFIKIHGHSKKERIIPIGFEAAYALKQYIDKGRFHIHKNNNNLVFVNSRGTNLSRVGFFKTLKTLSNKACIEKNISPQTLRHTFAFHMLENGVELKVLQDLLGHEDISSTYKYKHLD